MNRIKIKNALTFKPGKEVTICGWVRSFRANRFVAMNDGSCLANIQGTLAAVEKSLFALIQSMDTSPQV